MTYCTFGGFGIVRKLMEKILVAGHTNNSYIPEPNNKAVFKRGTAL